MRVLKNYQMSEQYLDCLDKMSEVNFSLAETLLIPYKTYSAVIVKNYSRQH